MNRKSAIALLILVLAPCFAVPVAAQPGGDGPLVFRARLNGYQEVPPFSTEGRGHFSATLDRDAPSLDYELEYDGLGVVTAAHIHFGRRAVNGGVIAFLCGGSAPPCPPSGGGPVMGTIGPGDIVGPDTQGILVAEFEEAIRAMSVGATYVNVHTTAVGSGEIRGQIMRMRNRRGRGPGNRPRGRPDGPPGQN